MNLQRPAMHKRQLSSSSFAEAFDAARQKLNQLELDVETPGSVDNMSDPGSLVTDSGPTSSLASPITNPITPALDPDVADDFAFAFDIDGVLVRGGDAIPEAVEAMKVLNGENEYGIRIPYIFLTNGGGKFETERCRDLSKQLEIDVSPGQFICGHTPMRELSDKYRGTVLVVGGEGEKCRQVAESYGFRDVITPGDIIKANSATAPFRKLTDAEHTASRDLLAEGKYSKLSDVVVDAVFVFADSRDWASDLQIIIDVAMSEGGRLETRSEHSDQGPPIYFSHNDVVWSAAHEHVRLGMGALRRIVEVVFEQCTGGKQLTTHAFGKPQVGTFEFATRLLQQWRAAQHGLTTTKPPSTVYFVGDTPESDIRGTNAMDAKTPDTNWYSILVKTGVYQDGTEPAYKPRATVPNVLDAVNYGIEREMVRRAAKGAGKMLMLDEVAKKAVAVPEINVYGDDYIVAE
ncbi:HAD-superfamily hydrolase [Coniochaeta ligniaria NRRL 30616]|uniref:HAD-superfamily hydrolase n=1 Tax=Coniochaeta ligniaria NRRL 30616 TaxID=1408157 RepID=A0A1J7JNF3_9PEZI|nr:HAD-superfamily hydrolase [Coniochaeta ligniaria NRRL 30616]